MHMTQKERKDVIKSLINEIKMQKSLMMDTLISDTMDETSFKYYKQGFGDGINIVIDILKEEL